MNSTRRNLRHYTIEELEQALVIYSTDDQKSECMDIEELQSMYNLFAGLDRDLRRLAKLASEVHSEFKFEIAEHVRKHLMG